MRRPRKDLPDKPNEGQSGAMPRGARVPGAGAWPSGLSAALVLALSALALSGCGGAASAATGTAGKKAPLAGAHPITVVASVFPLAQLISYIGGDDVHVIDLVSPGVQPQDLALRASQGELVRSAALVVDVGDGYQPQVESAALSAHNHLAVLPAISHQAQPYEFWLDPYLMAKAADVITASLVAADPSARRQFHNGNLDFQSVASSIESDFVNSLSQCQTAYFITSDDAFGRMASSFDLVDVPLSSAGATQALSAITMHNLPSVFGEDGVPSGAVDELARRAHISVQTLDPLELTPAGAGANESYFSLMEQDLSAMQNPLLCQNDDSFQ
ncbi:MAG TPA: metal ABC transporter substrate-binding protein [Acidimicrobiales bacterium]|nr:metal ABC transporter substrate-binding protein [Acidimicrobiales bacterium]